MGSSKIEVSVGNVSFSGEGDQGWLAEQLDKVLKAAPSIVATVRNQGEVKEGDQASADGEFNATLASYIKQKNAETSQVDRFLATADWLRRKGNSKLTTSAVSKALADNHQKKLANPADCLIKNVSKGFCEKSDGGFYITPDGLKKLGR